MKTSACNVYNGKILEVSFGEVNARVNIVLDSSITRLYSVISTPNAKTIGIGSGTPVTLFFNASDVTLITELEDGMKISSRNQLPGTVVSSKEGAVNSEVRILLDGGEPLTAMITLKALKEMGLVSGQRVLATVRSPNIMLCVKQK